MAWPGCPSLLVLCRGDAMADDHKPFHNPFATLGALTGVVPSAPAGSDSHGSKLPGLQVSGTPGLPVPTIPRAVVRIERSGRGGKEVTVIDHLAVPDREQWLKLFKSSLGCGGTVEDDRLVLQGDHRERVRALLFARGVKKITVA
jgi:translation initiation factor 1